MTTAADIRKRPGMYVGMPDEFWAPHAMLWEVVANAIDEQLAGHCRSITIDLANDGSAVIEDDGRGLRMDVVDGMPFAERALTRWHDTPTLDGHAFHTHLNRPGLSLFPVCALSAWVELEVHREGQHLTQRFERGVAVSEVRLLGATDRTGTRLAFLPDPEVITGRFDAGRIAQRLEELVRLLPGLTLTLTDSRIQTFRAKSGIVDFVAPSTRPGSRTYGRVFTCRDTEDDLLVEAAASWGVGRGTIESFANVERTREGTHVEGMLGGLVRGLERVCPEARRDVTRQTIARVLQESLAAVVCVRLADASFGAPTRDELINPHVEGVVQRVVASAFEAHLRSDPELLAMFAEKLGAMRT